MPVTLGELQRKRRHRERTMTQHCATSRATATASDGPGERDERTYAAHLADVHCRYIPTRHAEVLHGAGATRQVVSRREAVIVVPWGTDVRSGDLVTAVLDIEGNQINEGNLSIVGIDKPNTHVELRVEELGEVV